MTTADAPLPAGLDPFPEGSCEICGRFPAEWVHARKYTGLGVGGRTIFWKGLACRDCGVAQYRDGLTHCLVSGWWGLAPLVVNPVRLAQNTLGRTYGSNWSFSLRDSMHARSKLASWYFASRSHLSGCFQ